MNYAQQLEGQGFKIHAGDMRLRVELELGHSIVGTGQDGSYRFSAKNGQIQIEPIATDECCKGPLRVTKTPQSNSLDTP